MVQTAMASPLAERYRLSRITTHREGTVAQRVGVAALAAIRLLGTLILRRPDLLWVHMSARGSVQRKALLMAVARPFRVPVVIHSHGSQFGVYYESTSGWRRAVVRWALRHADAVIALGPSWEKTIQAMTPCNVTQILNPVAVPATLARDAQTPGLIVCTGRLGERKGSAVLVRAFAKIAAAHPQARLMLAGDGDPEPVRAVAAQCGVADRVELPGWVGPEEVADVLRRAAIFALPSQNEGLPIAMLEAMANGVPCVVTPVGGIPDVVTDGEHALLVPPDDPDRLAAALGELLDQPDVARRIGDGGRAMVAARCSTEVVSRDIAACFDRVLAAHTAAHAGR